jgi:hypothetical protein
MKVSRKMVVFLGPSMPLSQARAVLPEAIFLPPVGQSDLVSAIRVHRPEVVGIIDGFFSQSLSVWHKEILWALAQGVRVYGASSMGALRAAECAEFGMVGVGEIYRQYASGELVSDDEVALAHADADFGWRKLSEPLVNVRATLAAAVRDGVTEGCVAGRVVEVARGIFFADRRWQVLWQEALQQGVPAPDLERLERYARERYVDQKRLDALALIEVLHDLPEQLPPLPDFAFVTSRYFDATLARDQRTRRATGEVSFESIALHYTLHAPDFSTLHTQATSRAALSFVAELLGLQASEEELDDEERRFRLRVRVLDEGAYAAWLAANDTTRAEMRRVLASTALARKLQRWVMDRHHWTVNRQMLVDELRLQDRYREWADRAASAEAALARTSPHFLAEPSPEGDVGPLFAAHLRQTRCRPDVHVSRWWDDAGFWCYADLLIELQKAQLVREAS